MRLLQLIPRLYSHNLFGSLQPSWKSWTKLIRLYSSEGGYSRPETFQSAKLTDIGTRSIFSQEHDIFRESVRRFFREEVVPYHAQWEKDGQVSREVWLKAGSHGLLGIDTPTELGGMGGDFLMATVVLEEQAYSNCSGPGFRLHSNIVMPYITHYGTPEQIKRYIPNLTSGKWISAIAMTEPGAGSDLQSIRTTAIQDGSDWIINGSKTFITNGYMSDVVLTVAVTNPTAKSKAHGLSLFLVDASNPGLKKGRKLEKLGLKAQDTAELFYEDCRVPSSALLGEPNQGFYQLMQELPQERLMVGIGTTASCEFMFEETLAYVSQRKAFGKTLSALQTIRHKLAEIKTEVCVTRSFVDTCLKLHNQKKLDVPTAAMCKYWASDLQTRVADRCLQLHGGFGYMWEYPIAKAFVDARVQPIYAGTNEIMKELISRSIFTQK